MSSKVEYDVPGDSVTNGEDTAGLEDIGTGGRARDARLEDGGDLGSGCSTGTVSWLLVGAPACSTDQASRSRRSERSRRRQPGAGRGNGFSSATGVARAPAVPPQGGQASEVHTHEAERTGTTNGGEHRGGGVGGGERRAIFEPSGAGRLFVNPRAKVHKKLRALGSSKNCPTPNAIYVSLFSRHSLL